MVDNGSNQSGGEALAGGARVMWLLTIEAVEGIFENQLAPPGDQDAVNIEIVNRCSRRIDDRFDQLLNRSFGAARFRKVAYGPAIVLRHRLHVVVFTGVFGAGIEEAGNICP